MCQQLESMTELLGRLREGQEKIFVALGLPPDRPLRQTQKSQNVPNPEGHSKAQAVLRDSQIAEDLHVAWDHLCRVMNGVPYLQAASQPGSKGTTRAHMDGADFHNSSLQRKEETSILHARVESPTGRIENNNSPRVCDVRREQGQGTCPKGHTRNQDADCQLPGA